MIAAKEAKLWAATNTETASARIRAMRKIYPDFNPANPEWGKVFLRELKKENLISAWAKESKLSPNEDKAITVVGEIHGHPASAKKEIALIQQAAKEGTAILSLEEPRDLDWEPILRFLATIPKDTDPNEVESLGLLKGLPAKTASRISVVYTAKILGLEIALVDSPRAQKLQEQKRLEKETLHRIAYGDPFDKTKPISAVGGSKCLAENLRASYEASKPRSKAMAEALLALQSKGRKILHIGGKLHTHDIALALQEDGETTPHKTIVVSQRKPPHSNHPRGGSPKRLDAKAPRARKLITTMNNQITDAIFTTSPDGRKNIQTWVYSALFLLTLFFCLLIYVGLSKKPEGIRPSVNLKVEGSTSINVTTDRGQIVSVSVIQNTAPSSAPTQ